MDLGYAQLGNSLTALVVIRDVNQAPQDPTTAPVFRVYGQSPLQLMNNGSGSLTQVDTGTVTAATNASPIVVTSANHGLSTGTRVTVSGVTGNTAANGTWTITVTDQNTFSLNGSVGSGAYVSGGAWHTTGAYLFTLTPNGSDGYAAGQVYNVLVSYTVGANAYALSHTFTVY